MVDIGVLREIKDNELNMMRGWRNAPTIRANMYTRHEISSDEHEAWWIRARERTDQQYFMYEVGGRPLGIVLFTMIDLLNSNCSWAFYSAPDAPKGTGSKMEFLALEHAFSRLKLNKLYCEVLDFNMPVVKLHQKFGFQVEGLFRKHNKIENGYADIYRLGIFASEWASKRPEILIKLEAK